MKRSTSISTVLCMALAIAGCATKTHWVMFPAETRQSFSAILDGAQSLQYEMTFYSGDGGSQHHKFRSDKGKTLEIWLPYRRYWSNTAGNDSVQEVYLVDDQANHYFVRRGSSEEKQIISMIGEAKLPDVYEGESRRRLERLLQALLLRIRDRDPVGVE